MKRAGIVAGVMLMLGARSALAAIAISVSAPLAFGTLVSTPVAGSVTITPAGARSTNSVFAVGAGFSAASFTVTKTGAGNPHYSIVLPSSTTLIGPGGTLRVDGFASVPAGTGMAKPPSGVETLNVGATLHVGSNQAPGTYTGSFLITVVQQ